MKFKTGDLVFYRDNLTQRGDFTVTPLFIVLKHRTGESGMQRLLIQSLKTDSKGWDFARHYIKAPST
jgi:hypothetical protein|tara:strand:+ start:104 stop:304 length:201 start_codon:yes stop_codon:yes gene_type:complete